MGKVSLLCKLFSGIPKINKKREFKMKNLVKRILSCILVFVMLGSCATTPSTENPTSGSAPQGAAVVEQTPAPAGSGSEPSIVVLTEFPDGEVERAGIDVEYEVTASEGAVVKAVYCTVNGNTRHNIYVHGTDDEMRNKLGKGRFPLSTGGPNTIVFTVEDSAGKSAQFTVENNPWFKGYPQPIGIKDEDTAPLASGRGKFVINWIRIGKKADTPRSTIEQIAQELNGTIIWETGWDYADYVVQVPDSTEQELKTMCEQIKSKYSRLSYVHIEYVFDIDPNSMLDAKSPTNDPWWEWMEGNGDMSQWGLDRIGVPDVWKAHGDIFKDVKIGILDSALWYWHEDLDIPEGHVNNVSNKSTLISADGLDLHGVHVMGIIGASHNEKGIAGVIDGSQNSLFGYDVTSERLDSNEASMDIIDRHLAGLDWLVGEQGTQVVNASVNTRDLLAAWAEDMGMDVAIAELGGDIRQLCND